jgi:cytochrome c-type biogenesis protein CcmH
MIAWLCALALTGYAPERAGAPLDPPHEAEAERIGAGLRCAVCQGMSIVESPAPMAQAMLDRTREMVAEGKSEQEIRAYFVARYGEWILLEPPAHGWNWLVWVLPFLFLAGGIVLIVRVVTRAGGGPEAPLPPAPPSDDPYLEAVRREVEQ